MRPLPLVLLSLTLSCARADPEPAGSEAVPALGIVETLRIDAETADLSRVGFMLVSDDGAIVLTQALDEYIKVFGNDGSAATIGRKGGGPGEFINLTRIGWLHDSLWTLDPGSNRISVFDPDFKYVRSIPMRRPILDEDGSELPLPDQPWAQAMFPGNDIRVRVRPPSAAPVWWADVPQGAMVALRLAEDGAVRAHLGLHLPDPCAVTFHVGAVMIGTMTPLCQRPLDTANDGTSSVAHMALAAGDDSSSAYRVTVVTADGDTTFSRVISYTVTEAPASVRDSVADRREAYLSAESSAEVRDRIRAIPIAETLPPVLRLVLGRDESVWVEETRLDPGHHWLILDPSGEPAGRVTVPGNFRMMVAELGTIWGLEADDDGLESIVRYRVR